jgi:Sulfotransferase domain
MASPREGVGLPAFIIIGAMKSGTSSLHHYLRQHPEICMSAAKEPNFFIEARNFGKGVDWYRSLFADHTKVCGEASPAYSKRHRHEGVPERLREVVPHVKLIYVLRDPIDRIVSHYLHNRVLGRETRSLAAAVAAKSYRNNYVRTSMYGFQLAAFLPHFPLERILIAATEDLKDRRAETLRSMFRFIGVDPRFEKGDFDRLVNQTPLADQASRRGAPGGDRSASAGALSGQGSETLARPALDREDRDRLAEHLAPDVEQLRALSGLRFERWSL